MEARKKAAYPEALFHLEDVMKVGWITLGSQRGKNPKLSQYWSTKEIL